METNEMNERESLDLISRMVISNQDRMNPDKLKLMNCLAWLWLGGCLLLALISGVFQKEIAGWEWVLCGGVLLLGVLGLLCIKLVCRGETVRSYKDVMVEKVMYRIFFSLVAFALMFLIAICGLYDEIGTVRYDLILVGVVSGIWLSMLGALGDVLMTFSSETQKNEYYQQLQRKWGVGNSAGVSDPVVLLAPVCYYFVSLDEVNLPGAFVIVAVWSVQLFLLSFKLRRQCDVK